MVHYEEIHGMYFSMVYHKLQVILGTSPQVTNKLQGSVGPNDNSTSGMERAVAQVTVRDTEQSKDTDTQHIDVARNLVALRKGQSCPTLPARNACPWRGAATMCEDRLLGPTPQRHRKLTCETERQENPIGDL